MPSNRPEVAVRLPVEVRDRLRAEAAEQGVSVTAVVEGILARYVAAGARLASSTTALLVLRPDPGLVAQAKGVAQANAEALTAVIRAAGESLPTARPA